MSALPVLLTVSINNQRSLASRDTTAIAWSRSSTDSQFTQQQVYHPGSRYINSVTYLPATNARPQAYVVTGGQDALINVYSLGSPKSDPDYTLVGHSDNVCTLHSTPSGTIISGSWDKTARVWKDFNQTHELLGHSQAVWAVLAVDDDNYLTGSADKTIRAWHNHKTIRTYTGHADAVRALCLVPELGFASCSNDSEIRVWTTEGDIIHTLSGHTSFVYSLALLPNGDVISGGEDRSLRVWKDGSCHQTIVHPAVSVWTVSSLPNGDIATGCSDGVVRIFSSEAARWASADELKEYDDIVAAQLLPSQQVGDVKKADLPGPEALLQPGKKNGQVLMVRSGDVVEAHQWDGAQFQWQKVGEVVDAVGSGRKQLHEGKEYDYVFDVDIQDGVPPLKLPYNAHENPFQAAKRFLEANELPMSYIDEVVQFIEKSTKGATLGTSNEEYMDPFTGASRYRSAAPAQQASNQGFVDPFTGASRYQPTTQVAASNFTGASASPTQHAPSQGFADPFTGASRYQPAPQVSASDSTGAYSDPFTGGSRYTPQAQSPSQPTTTPSILPIKTCLGFKQANVSAMKNKLLSINSELTADQTLALSPAELSLLEETFTALSPAVATKSTVGTALSWGHIENILQLIKRWPIDKVFPLIDLGRVLTAFAPRAFSSSSECTTFFNSLLGASDLTSEWTIPLPKPQEINILLALRALANAVQDSTAPANLIWADEALRQVAGKPLHGLGKNHSVAVSTLVFNISVVLLKGAIQPNIGSTYWILLSGALKESDDPEAFYRALAAWGNTLYASKISKISMGKLESGDIQAIREKVGRLGESRMSDMMKAIDSL